MEHFDLEDAFGRRPQPVLKFIATLVVRPGDDPFEDVHLALLNEGRGIAKYPGLTLEFSPDVSIVDVARGLNNNSNINNGRPIVSYQDDIRVIHSVPIQTRLGAVTIKRMLVGAPLRIDVRWYCEGMSQRSFSGLLRPQEPLVAG